MNILYISKTRFLFFAKTPANRPRNIAGPAVAKAHHHLIIILLVMLLAFAKIRCAILLALVCSACCFAAFDPSPVLSDTVFVEDSNAVEYGISGCDEGAQSCIVVARGCREEYFAVNEKVDSNEPNESLLARVYGAEPLQDSSKVYSQWASDCKQEESRPLHSSLFTKLACTEF